MHEKLTTADATREEWVLKVRDELAGAEQKSLPRLRSSLSCRKLGGKASLFISPDMAEDQPEVLQYLDVFAANHGLSLIEDRRNLQLSPIVERRKQQVPTLAMGLSLLLKQTGLPGPTRTLSNPHVLNKGNERIDLSRLIRTAAGVFKQSRKVVFLPNQFLCGSKKVDEHTMNGYACKVVSGENQMTFAQFESEDFHAIGYISNDQFVVTVFLAGGPIARPQLWTNMDHLLDAPFRCQLYPSPFPGQEYGFLYQTYYIDIAAEESKEKSLHIHSA